MKVTKDDKVKIGCLAIIFVVMAFAFTQCMRSGAKDEGVPTTKVMSSQSDKEQQALEIIKENFDATTEVEFDPQLKAYLLTPKDENFKIDILELVNNPDNSELLKEWNALGDSLKYASNELKGVVGQGYSIVIVNPDNVENQLLTASDGEIIYNFVNEK